MLSLKFNSKLPKCSRAGTCSSTGTFTLAFSSLNCVVYFCCWVCLRNKTHLHFVVFIGLNRWTRCFRERFILRIFIFRKRFFSFSSLPLQNKIFCLHQQTSPSIALDFLLLNRFSIGKLIWGKRSSCSYDSDGSYPEISQINYDRNS